MFDREDFNRRYMSRVFERGTIYSDIACAESGFTLGEVLAAEACRESGLSSYLNPQTVKRVLVDFPTHRDNCRVCTELYQSAANASDAIKTVRERFK